MRAEAGRWKNREITLLVFSASAVVVACHVVNLALSPQYQYEQLVLIIIIKYL